MQLPTSTVPNNSNPLAFLAPGAVPTAAEPGIVTALTNLGGIPEFDQLLDKARAKAPARSLVSIEDVGVATAFLAHDAARLITGETLYIDGGYHIID